MSPLVAAPTSHVDNIRRQLGELIVGQIQLLQTDQVAHAGRQALQLVVGEVLEQWVVRVGYKLDMDLHD